MKNGGASQEQQWVQRPRGDSEPGELEKTKASVAGRTSGKE